MGLTGISQTSSTKDEDLAAPTSVVLTSRWPMDPFALPHLKESLARLAYRCECFGQDIIWSLAVGQLRSQASGGLFQLRIGELRVIRLELIDSVESRAGNDDAAAVSVADVPHATYGPLVRRTEHAANSALCQRGHSVEELADFINDVHGVSRIQNVG